jgi:chromosome segregation ATPase
MGWVSYLEDIKKKAEELDNLVKEIETGSIPYTDTARGRVSDISRHIRIQVASLERTLLKLGVDDQNVINEILEFGEKVNNLTSEKEKVETELKRAYEKVSEFKQDQELEKKKFEYAANLFLRKGPHVFSEYLTRIGFK